MLMMVLLNKFILKKGQIVSSTSNCDEAMMVSSSLSRRRRCLFSGLLSVLALCSLFIGGEAFSFSSRNALSSSSPSLAFRHEKCNGYLPHSASFISDRVVNTQVHCMNMSLRSFRRGLDGSKTGDEGGANQRRVWVKNKTIKIRNSLVNFIGRTEAQLQRLIIWQRKNRRNALAAAFFAFSVLFCSNTLQQVKPDGTTSKDYVEHSDQHSPVKSKTTTLQNHLQVTGGGSNVASTSTMVKKASSQMNHPPSRSNTNARSHSNSGLTKSTIVPKKNSIFQKKSRISTPPLAAQIQLDRAEQAFEDTVMSASRTTSRTLREAFEDLADYMKGPKSDTLLLLLATALITPLCQRLKTSPILGFLAAGMLLGPNGWGMISGIHTTETLAELGIVFFLFEMGIELSFERLLSMRRDVFGLGLSQFVATALAVAGVGSLFKVPANALVVLGGGLALSSSAFVLQLLKDKDQLATRFGKASFGVLLFQDLAVVPLLVVTPILAGSGRGLASALGSALVKAALALGSIAFVGRVILNPLFKTVAQAQSQEAFLGVILLTVLSMSFMTEGLGLSNTLGAFLAGVLLSETKYRYQVEADIAPFRGILLGLFFVTVGFEIDVNLIMSNLPLVSGIVMGTVALKALITTALSLSFGLSLSTSQQAGLLLSQGGEFAFVAFGLARGLGILDPATTKLMLTSVSLTMAITPFLYEFGSKIAKKLEEESDFTHYLGQDRDANEIKESDDFAVVIGYGAVGKVVCELLDRKFIKFIGLEIDPNKAIQARNRGLPVFYGDIGRPEVAEAFNVGHAKAVIVTIADRAQANRAIISLRRMYPEMKIFARAADADHAERLQRTLDVAAMVPILPEDNVLMTLPFGGAVLKSLGAPAEEVNAILEAKRKEVLSKRGLSESEEQDVLTQLGIITESKKESEAREMEESAKATEEDEDKHAKMSAAAAAAIQESKQKSPMLAQIITANIPDSATKEKANESSEDGKEKIVKDEHSVDGDSQRDSYKKDEEVEAF